MELLYIAALCGLLIFMNFVGIRAQGQRSPLARALRQLMVMVTVTVAAGMLPVLMPSEAAALFVQCIHYAGTEWLLIFLLRFLEQYTEDVWSKKSAKIIIYSLAVVNSVSMLLNGAFHHIVTCRYTDIGNGVMCYVFMTQKPWYSLHLCFTYVLVACNLGVLIRQSVITTKFYRKKYSVALLMLVITVAMDGVCTIMDYPLDYSLYAYVILAIALTYYSIYYIPQGLITKTLSYVVADSSSGVVCFDVIGKCIYANEMAMSIYGNPSELSAMEPIFRKELGEKEFSNAKEGKWDREFILNGHTLYFDMNFSKLFDEQENYIGCYFILHDKTEDMEKLEREHYRSTHDILTGLFNREYFYECVKKRREMPDEEYYMTCTNIKDFKLINDLFGAEMGDAILIRLAEVMKEALPEGTICGRLESDHFAFCIRKELFQESALIDGINEVARMIPSSEYHILIHIGVYAVQRADYDAAVMCDRANIAIGTVKDSYDCMIAYYDESLMERVMSEKRLVSEFDSALADGQFVMFLQPQVSTAGTVLGAEALVRWMHPQRGMVSPGEFIKAFENAGLIYRLDQYIWDLAAQKLREWKDSGHEDLHISVNISAKDFYYLDIYRTFVDLVEKYDIPPKKLKLEITETALMMDLEKQLVLLDKLQSYGFNVEIDDFGSGYSSLNMLKDIHADVLKIDMGFLRKTQDNERAQIILRMIIELAKQLHMIVITEGVESKAQVDYLTETGCDMFQGFYFARPVAVPEFEQRYM
ncbi:MAG: EAL domain-containing protein [Bacillota bacterium]|nr:EAL domain-containing protein [Bacillota bacterium]